MRQQYYRVGQLADAESSNVDETETENQLHSPTELHITDAEDCISS